MASNISEVSYESIIIDGSVQNYVAPGKPSTIAQERDIVSNLHSLELVKGEMWYAISAKWFNMWCQYTGFIPDASSRAQFESGFAEPSGEEPGQIDNSPLLDDTKPLWSEIKAGLQESKDYVFVHNKLWNVFVEWYGIKHPRAVFPRAVVCIGFSQMTIVDPFPIFLRCVYVNPTTGDVDDDVTYIFALSKFHSLNVLISHLLASNIVSKNPKFFQPPVGRIWVKRSEEDDSKERVDAVDPGSEFWTLVRDADLADKIENIDGSNVSGSILLVEFLNFEKKWSRSARMGERNSNIDNMMLNLKPGDECDCRDQQGTWFESQISERKDNKLKVHFKGWGTKYDEWINLSTELIRLAPKNTHTTGPYVPKSSARDDIFSMSSHRSADGRGLVGLRNLGNTCFMNSIIQCLAQAPGLTPFFVENRHIRLLNRSNPLGWGGKIAEAWGSVVSDIWRGDKNLVSPKDLKQVIGEFQPRFQGYAQQDSSELLQFLLDGLHEDLNQIISKPITQAVESDGRPDKIVADLAWETHLKRNKSIIVDTCYLQLKSRVECPRCGRVSITFDPDSKLDCPLPVPKDRFERKTPTWTVVFAPSPSLALALDPIIKQELEKVIESFPKEALEKRQMEQDESMASSLGSLYSLYAFRMQFKSDGDIMKRIRHDGLSGLLTPDILEDDIYFLEFKGHKLNSFHRANTSVFQLSENTTYYLVYVPDVKMGPFASNPTTRHVVTHSTLNVLKDHTSGRSFASSLFGIPTATSLSVNSLPPSVETTREYCLRVCLSLLPYVRDFARVFGSDANSQPEAHPGSVLSFEQVAYALRESFSLVLHSEDYSRIFVTIDDSEAPLRSSISSLCPSHHCVAVAWKTKHEIGDLLFTEESQLRWHPARNPDAKMRIEEYKAQKEEKSSSSIGSSVAESKRRRVQRPKMAGSIQLEDCLELFTNEEVLGKGNEWYCSKCRDHVNAKKKLEVWKLSDVLIITLKRFNYERGGGSNFFSRYGMGGGGKIETLVDFPVSGLDMSYYCADEEEKKRADEDPQSCLYDLFAVSHHFGGMGGGHYVASGRHLLNGDWYNFDDSSVSKLAHSGSEDEVRQEVVKSSAYVLFYKRRKPVSDLFKV